MKQMDYQKEQECSNKFISIANKRFYKYNMLQIQNKNKNYCYPLIILTILILELTEGQMIKTISSACLCDTTTNCDYQCCCDSQCPSSLKTMLAKYDKCNDDNFGIPLCDASVNDTASLYSAAGVGSSMHFQDLYSGLRTIYTVVKKLFCVQRVNIVDPTTFYNRLSTQAVITDTISRVNAIVSSSTFQPDNISSLPKATINGLFEASQIGTCVQTNQIPKNIGTDIFRQCRAYLDFTTAPTNRFLSGISMSSSFSNIRFFSMKQSTIANPTPIPSASLSTVCTASSCSDVVRYLKLFIDPTNNIVRQDLSYVVVGDLENVQNNSYIIVKYDYTYLNQDGSFPKVSNIGYKIGSPLQLLKKDGTSFWTISNPINLAFRKPNGDCRSTNTADLSDQSLIQLRLGRNQFHTCIGDLSIIYNNLKNSFDYLGMMGSSNNVLADFVAVDWPTQTVTTDNIVLKIYYMKVGAIQNPQYFIVKASVQIKTNSARDKALFIEYQQVQSTFSTYIPPPPKVDAYLPNDFLFPFYVAQ